MMNVRTATSAKNTTNGSRDRCRTSHKCKDDSMNQVAGVEQMMDARTATSAKNATNGSRDRYRWMGRLHHPPSER